MAADHVPTPAPLHHLPTAKEKRYDRQLRLWGASGQAALEETHILLINNGSGVTGIEALKNLVLPGTGHFSILDSAIVSEPDLGVNFFLEDESLGKFRAAETVTFLEELNPDVEGHAITEPLESFLQQPDNLKHFTLILVAAPILPAALAQIKTIALDSHIPLFYSHCIGFYSHFSVQLPPAFPVVDTHPDPTATQDLRLLKPWPALVEFAKEKTNSLGTMSQHDFGHIPYVCILLHYIEEYKAKNEGRIPESYKEKTAVREMVRAAGKDEENFEEAYAAVLKSLNPPTPPSSVREILNAPEAQNLSAASSSFWIIANAIQQFYVANGVLPLPGAVPDMKAQSKDYIKLQQIYKSKAREDCAAVTATVRSLEQSLNRSSKSPIDDKEIENFCKGAAHIHLVRGRPLPVVEAGKPLNFSDRAKFLTNQLTIPDSLLGLYIAFLAFDEFIATHTSTTTAADGTSPLAIPGLSDTDYEADADKLTGIAHTYIDNLIDEAGSRIEDPEYSELKEEVGKLCVEITRAGGSELHNVASLTGGVVAQEIIKVLTAQYVPVDNCCLYDGVQSRMSVLRV